MMGNTRIVSIEEGLIFARQSFLSVYLTALHEGELPFEVAVRIGGVESSVVVGRVRNGEGVDL